MPLNLELFIDGGQHTDESFLTTATSNFFERARVCWVWEMFDSSEGDVFESIVLLDEDHVNPVESALKGEW